MFLAVPFLYGVLSEQFEIIVAAVVLINGGNGLIIMRITGIIKTIKNPALPGKSYRQQ